MRHEARQVPSWLIFDVRQITSAMKSLLVYFATVLSALSTPGAPGDYVSIVSPSGRIAAKIGIAGPEASPSVRMRVRVVFETSSAKALGEVWTGLKSRWVALWSDGDVLLVGGPNEEKDGSPMEYYRYDVANRKGPDKAPSESERAKVQSEFERKYGPSSKKKRPNKAPEPTPGLVTPRALE
jgi:hypothetical protein